MANVMGYYQTPQAPTYPVAGAVVPPTGLVQTASWDSWKPSSNSDPYVAGMRTSASAVAAVSGASSTAANVRFSSYSAWKAAGSRAGAKAASKSGSFFGMTAVKTKAMSMARTSSQKSAFMSSITSGPKTAGVGSALRFSFFSLGNVARAVGTSALVAVPIALVTNFLDWKAGKVTTDQRNALIVADMAGYTATGATSTLVGGMIGSTFMGPVLGTIAGVAAGFALGWVYEKFIRPTWGNWVHNALYASPPAPVLPPPPVVVAPPTLEPK